LLVSQAGYDIDLGAPSRPHPSAGQRRVSQISRKDPVWRLDPALPGASHPARDNRQIRPEVQPAAAKLLEDVIKRCWVSRVAGVDRHETGWRTGVGEYHALPAEQVSPAGRSSPVQPDKIGLSERIAIGHGVSSLPRGTAHRLVQLLREYRSSRVLLAGCPPTATATATAALNRNRNQSTGLDDSCDFMGISFRIVIAEL
jgi:hypothetical protein